MNVPDWYLVPGGPLIDILRDNCQQAVRIYMYVCREGHGQTYVRIHAWRFELGSDQLVGASWHVNDSDKLCMHATQLALVL